MSMSPYTYIVYIAPDSEFEFNDLHRRLSALYEARPRRERVHSRATTIQVVDGGWTYHIRLSEAAHVNEEARDVEGFMKEGDPRRARLAASTARLELHGDRDSDMRYWHHSDIVLDELKKYDGLFIFDPMTPGFL